jgi:hypothetical protein
MKKLKLRKGYALCILLALVFCVGCNTTTTRNIEEYSVVERISKSNNNADMKYWVVTNDYNFYTNREFSIGDTVRLVN